MKKYMFIALLIPAFLIGSCGRSQIQKNEYTLSAAEFSQKMKGLATAIIVDVRTPGEFSQGHIENAVNIDWNGNDFEKEIENLDKTKPIFVYCLSGKRSAAAANKMRSKGFELVYELEGGITKWRAANLPETKEN